MEKLMDTDPYDRAMPRKMIGHDMFGDTYPTCSTTCQDQKDCDDCPIQEAFARLRQYEQTGLTPPEIMELKERDTEHFCKTSIFDHESVVCKCGNDIEKDSGFDFCPYCGNRIKLED